MKRLLWILIFFAFSIIEGFSQVDTLSQPSGYGKGDVYFEISSQAFFDNLEFFNDIQRGYTLTGFNLEPRLAYAINSKAKFSAGAHMLYFSGEERFTRFVPVLTFHAQILPNLILNMGTIESVGNHGLPEQLFKAEREFTHQPECGLQFIYSSNSFFADTWVNWERFLFQGDTIQEEFTAGFSSRLFLKKDGSLQVDIPIYALAVHRGGQINFSSERVSTLANFGGGINFSTELFNDGKIGIVTLLLLGRDLSPNPHHPYEKGWAIFPRLYFQSTKLFLDAGYWRANEMILPRGEEIFGSVSTVDPIFNTSKRELIIGNIIYRKEIATGFSLAAGGQIYFDIREPLLDYSFSLVATFRENFLLNKR